MRAKNTLLTVCLMVFAACEPESQDMQNASPESGPLAFAPDGHTIFIASADHDTILFVDVESREVMTEVLVGDHPEHVLSWDADTLLSTSRYGHTLERIDIGSAEVAETLAVGVEPMGMAIWDDSHVAVALAGEQALAVVHVETMQLVHHIPLAHSDPRAVAKVGDTSVMVSHMTAGTLSQIDTTTLTARMVSAQTVNEFGPPMQASQFRSLTVDPVRGTVLIAHTQANTTPVRSSVLGFLSEGEGAVEDMERDSVQGACGYSGCFGELGAVSAAVTEITPAEGQVMVPLAAEPDQGDTNCGLFSGPCRMFEMPRQNPPSVFNPFELRFAGLTMNNPVAMAVVAGGNGMLVVNQGTHNALLLRRKLTGTFEDVVGFYRIGAGASGLAVNPQGTEAWVWNQFDGSVTILPLPETLDASNVHDSRFLNEDRQWPWQVSDEPNRREFEAVESREFQTSTIVLISDDLLSEDVALGRRLFHDATNSNISRDGTISCASCHPDGRSDGQTWQFDFGPRNTPQLGGGIMDTAPFHWPGDVTTHRDLNSNTILAFMGGHGLSDGSMDQLGEFMDTIPGPPTVALHTAELSEAEERGRAIFYREDVQCGTCHLGGDFTDDLNWDIGSKSDERDIQEFQTPVLHGLSRTAPYLHDGSSPTLEHFVETWVRSDRMGRGSHLSDTEVNDLLAFLKSL